MYAKVILVSLLVFFMVGCSSADPLQRFSLPIQLQLEANEKLNWANEVANPVAVRVYQLTKSDRFMQSEFISLFQSDTQILAEQLIEKQRLYPVMPNTKQQKTLKLLPGVRYLAVLVEFSDYQQGTTKAVIEVPEDVSENTVIWLGLQGTSIKFSVIPQQSWMDSLFSWGA
ncbi:MULTISPECIES: type VI secretion system lipoprotein TssJ [Pseudoalteromonas]|uniref:type VI secretion system lipoprotein TssJ n=1 Tax=Pseudoalteromonas TaxID=53246 RepID=UPI000F64BE5E|nr:MULTISPECIES: type VI secretion system lipoprotein TssJ [Pseudoalteromonas]MDW7551239.1 type VI secretion system lipoprotein TssJ [Pseudoalteromonas peptidolytica]RRS10375.1 type VI secretion system lipoprotein TssJ [Pseudoalteromonas sp. J010]RXE98097.1 type VI secretion system lipoprotein TssJ [Pseudoalteromonas sp. PS5]USD28423.1 type VI secretion system lipoprotein TssJ [Pseudoalteromonas sp. SCSIO 43201]